MRQVPRGRQFTHNSLCGARAVSYAAQAGRSATPTLPLLLPVAGPASREGFSFGPHNLPVHFASKLQPRDIFGESRDLLLLYRSDNVNDGTVVAARKFYVTLVRLHMCASVKSSDLGFPRPHRLRAGCDAVHVARTALSTGISLNLKLRTAVEYNTACSARLLPGEAWVGHGRPAVVGAYFTPRGRGG